MGNGSGGMFPMFSPDGDDGGNESDIPNWITILWLILGLFGSTLATYFTYIDPLFDHDWVFWITTTLFFFTWIFFGPLSFVMAFLIWITI